MIIGHRPQKGWAMAIRKYGTEPAKVETRVEDNDQETLRTVKTGDTLSSIMKRAELESEQNSGDGQSE